ncbi:efflux RND transporter periplasmic adaptor subunit [Desmonostoc muscorum LEGE 12446]|uniref:Efflux RND transporter periplasmic adaptor subunit n=1 Tax=Desmonostoc muscorum LEGE 12446 TaxID=1828758 RepID=A0A8J7DCK5_DESMC|nr:efflux RND transporter periplasmic adaptor subunit [Desmonostoc muscorum]MCF2150821.1 efflux RND transporter periplasmic adaptor subunit [Desmonostoc muscorum LEGE 12446]
MSINFQSLQQNLWPICLRKQLQSRWLIGLLLLAGVAGGGFMISRAIAPSQNLQNQILTVPLEQRSLPITLTANGTVKAERTINLSPKSAGYLKRLLVKEGDRVRQGQILAYMDDSNLQGQLIESRGQLAQQQANLKKLLSGNRSQEIAQSAAQFAEAEARLQQLQAGNRFEDISQAQARLEQAQAKLQQAEDDLQRNQQLFKQGAISRQTLNQRQADRNSAQAQVKEAQAALTLQKRGTRPEEIAQARAQVEQRREALNLLKAGSRPEDIDAARAQVESARGKLETIQTQINDTIITAPFDGTVTKKYAEPGSFVTPTTPGSAVEGAASNSILTLAATNEIVANLDEANIPLVKVGQKVLVKADAYPNRTFKGKVSQIAAQASTVQNVTSFEVKIALEETAQQLLKAGMNVEVEFLIGELNHAIVVPSVAIVRQENRAGVYVMSQDQKPVFKPIELGTTVGDRTEVKSGLTGNERVLISFPPGTQPKSEFQGPFGNPNSKNNNSQSTPLGN